MGTTDSREESRQHIQEEPKITPVQNRRVLKLQDPRSPTDAIQRTPIITDAPSTGDDFHDPRSPTAMICRTPVTEDQDPRSPTEGIPRTPANPFIFPDPRSPSVGITRTPLMKPEEGESKFDTEVRESEANLRERMVRSGDGKSEKIDSNANNGTDSNTLETQAEITDEPRDASDAPRVEMEMAKMSLDESINPPLEEESTPKEVQGDSQCTTLVVEDSAVRHRRASAKKSLKAKFGDPTTPLSLRSPLSTRSLLQNSPSVNENSPLSSGGVVKQQNPRMTRPTRLVGRYQTAASLDKENL